LAAGFVYLYVPETKRRTLECIQHLWLRGEHVLPGSAPIRSPAALEEPSIR
jgi:hypothetical protein